MLKLLSIDDDPLIHKIVKKTLDRRFIISTASDGKAGVKAAVKECPNVILLDVEMPGMNGYEVSDYLKHTTATADIPIIFLSSLSNSRSRMLGYEAGGVDYLVKPFDPEELIAKLDAITALTQTNSSLKVQVKHATDTAFTAMKSSSELGLSIQFIEASYEVRDPQELANAFLQITSCLKLSCILMFQIGKEKLYFSSNGQKCSPLETEVVSTIFEKGTRFVDFGCRTQVNFPNVSLLVKNMPIGDMEAYGRYKDFLPSMLGVTDAKISALETEQNMKKQESTLIKAFSEVRETLLKFGEKLESNQDCATALLQTMLSEFEHDISTLELDHDHEAHFLKKIDVAVSSTKELVDNRELNNHMFKNVSKVLKTIADRQVALLAPLDIKPKTTIVPQPNVVNVDGVEENIDEDLSGNVELF